MAMSVGSVTCNIKLVGIGGKKRLAVLAFIAKVFRIKLDVTIDDDHPAKKREPFKDFFARIFD